MPDILPNASRIRRAASAFATRSVVAACFLAAAASVAVAQQSDRWRVDAVEARATLPLPRNNEAVTALSLSCAAQRWTLDAAIAAPAALDDGAATLTVDNRPHALAVTLTGGLMSAPVPRAALDPLKSALQAELVFADEAIKPVSLSLRGSKLAITALEERCTPRDMSAYQPVTFTPYSSYIGLARTLRENDIKVFAAATASQPVVTAAMAEIGVGKRILFTRLCGSSWYFGRSGCNITGFVPETDPNDDDDGEAAITWRVVYDTESVILHTDPKTLSHGWPDIVTIPARGSGSGLIWRWSGTAYELKGSLPEDEQTEPLQLRPTQD